MALELFKPFVMKRLDDLNHAQNIKSAKRWWAIGVRWWDVLEEVISEHPVLQTVRPRCTDLASRRSSRSSSRQGHPDPPAGLYGLQRRLRRRPDGRAPAAGAEAQAEARMLMLSTNNILKPADGRPVTMPTQDMIIGTYFLTMQRDGAVGEQSLRFGGRAAPGSLRPRPAVGAGQDQATPPPTTSCRPTARHWRQWFDLAGTTLGRALFSEALPDDYAYADFEVGKKQLRQIVNDLAERYPKVEVAHCLDQLKRPSASTGRRVLESPSPLETSAPG